MSRSSRCDAPRETWASLDLDLGDGTPAEVFTADERQAAMNALRPAAWTDLKAQGGTAASPEDLLIAGGLVWSAATTRSKDPGIYTGRDPATGKVEPNLVADADAHALVVVCAAPAGAWARACRRP